MDVNQWLTIDVDAYRFSGNGQETYLAKQMTEQGTYNVLIGQPNSYDGKATEFEESHSMFGTVIYLAGGQRVPRTPVD